jgi:predicted dehydrogenase
VALVGTGIVSHAHEAAAVVAGTRITHLVSRRRDHEIVARAARIGARLVDRDASPEGVVEAVSSADVVVVASPVDARAGLVEALLGAGHRVVVELPFARSPADADRLIAAARTAPGALRVAVTAAHAPAVAALWSDLRGIGTSRFLEARFLDPVPPHPRRTYVDRGTTIVDELAAQPIAVALASAALLGLGRPTVVAARVAPADATGTGTGTDELTGIRIDLTWSPTGHDDASTPVTGRVDASWSGGSSVIRDLQVAGTRAVLRAELLPTSVLERNGMPMPVVTGSGTSALDSLWLLESAGHVGVHRAITDWVAGRSDDLLDATVGWMTTEVAAAAMRSASADGTEVPLPVATDREPTSAMWWSGR